MKLLILFLLLLLFSIIVLIFFSIKINSYKLDHKEKITDIKKEIKKLKDKEFNEEEYVRLLKLYKDGIHDIYDNKGNKLHGLEPDINKTFDVLYSLIKNCPERENFYKLKLADIYLNGMHKFKPDRQEAKILYQQINNEEALEKLRRINEEEHWESVYGWLNLKKPSKNQNLIIPTLPKPVVMVTNHDVINQILGRGDSQNAHNSQVISTIKKSVEGLKKNTIMSISQDSTVKQIRNFMGSYLQGGDKQNDAEVSLSRILENNKPLMSTGMKEIEALHLVWNRIHSPIHDERRETLKENLMDELVNCQEFGHTVCSSGRFDRIIDTLNVSDPEVKIMDTNAINGEIMNSTSQLRNTLSEGYSEPERKQLDMGTHTNQILFDDNFKQKIRDKAKTDYVDTGIMTQKKMDNTLEKWINLI
jgi:hypothetical protein